MTQKQKAFESLKNLLEEWKMFGSSPRQIKIKEEVEALIVDNPSLNIIWSIHRLLNLVMSEVGRLDGTKPYIVEVKRIRDKEYLAL